MALLEESCILFPEFFGKLHFENDGITLKHGSEIDTEKGLVIQYFEGYVAGDEDLPAVQTFDGSHVEFWLPGGKPGRTDPGKPTVTHNYSAIREYWEDDQLVRIERDGKQA